jgi:hypothetical protein
LWLQKKVRKINFFPSSFVAVVGSGIRDPGWIKIRILDKHPGSTTLITGVNDICDKCEKF